MTVAATGVPATASSSEAVAGLHLAVDRERDVEHDLLVVAGGLQRHGVRVTWLSTHRTVTPLGASCSAAVTAAVDASTLAGYLDVVAREELDAVGEFSTGRGRGSDADRRAGIAAAARADRAEGRAVWFPGHDAVGAEITVGSLLARTAVDAVEVLGGAEFSPETLVQTRGFLRPRFVGGRLVLHAQPARGGVLVPFETPSPTPCCADHATVRGAAAR